MRMNDKREIKRPKLSVIMSVFNESKTLEKSIKSILNQKFQNFEFIILNDGSIDSSEKIIKKHCKKNKKILHIYSEKNRGLTFMLNLGIKYARGEYIVRHDADDYSFKNRLYKQFLFMEKNKNIYILGTNSRDYIKNNKKFKISQMPTDSKTIKEGLIKKNHLIHSSLIIRKKFFKKVGLYNPQFLKCQDYELWLRGRGRFEYTNLKDVMITRNIDKSKFKFLDLYLVLKAKLMHSKRPRDVFFAIFSSFKDLFVKILNFLI